MITDPKRDDTLWQSAWRWVMREHEQPLSEAQREELLAWLAVDERHRATYDEAARLWLLSGLVPPAHGGNDPAE